MSSPKSTARKPKVIVNAEGSVKALAGRDAAVGDPIIEVTR